MIQFVALNYIKIVVKSTAIEHPVKGKNQLFPAEAQAACNLIHRYAV
jgi:hypothetical protein